MIQNFDVDLHLLYDLINGDKPFAFMKFADGERMLIEAKAVGVETQAYREDKWFAPQMQTLLGKDLRLALQNEDPNVYFGISCDCCDPVGKEYLWSLIKNKKQNITFSNIFVNANYPLAVDFLQSIKEPINLIANYVTDVDKFPIKVKDFLPVPDNCAVFYESYKYYFLKTLDRFKNITNELFIVSAGPLSEVIINYLWKINPNNKYVDVGSAIGEWVHGRPIRDFSNIYSPFRARKCAMYLSDKIG